MEQHKDIVIKIGQNHTTGVGISSHNIEVNEYKGKMIVEPTDFEQTFPTKDKRMTDDFTVEPIPCSYGKVSYNGTTLKIE